MIELRNITSRLGEFSLGPLDLAVPEGRYCVLLGPPGSGKTTTIEIICGLRPHRGGRVVLGGRDVGGLDPAERRVGYVPQDYALFTSMSVFENIAFGLKIRWMRRRDVARLVQGEADRLGIGYLLGRSCAGLSGGERQRVALARALVLKPRVLLLDEPVSALDESTRERVCLELRTLHESLGITTVHVSHNFEETHIVADQVAVLNHGRIAQVGTVGEVFGRPRTEFVARFIRAGNVLRAGVASADGGRVQLTLAGQSVSCPGWPAGSAGAAGEVAVLLRSQDAAVIAPDAQPPEGHIRLPGRVVAVRDTGGLQLLVRVAVSDGEIISVAVPRGDGESSPWAAGDAVAVAFDPCRLHRLDPDAAAP